MTCFSLYFDVLQRANGWVPELGDCVAVSHPLPRINTCSITTIQLGAYFRSSLIKYTPHLVPRLYAAFLGALCASMPSMRPIQPGSAVDGAMRDSYQRLMDAGVEPCENYPASVDELWPKFSRGVVAELQRLLTAKIEKAVVTALHDAANAQGKARLRSAAGKWAGTWLVALPSSTELSEGPYKQ